MGTQGGGRIGPHLRHIDNIGPPDGRGQTTETMKANGEPSHPLSARGLNAGEVPRTRLEA
jgi:hypothetical protein